MVRRLLLVARMKNTHACDTDRLVVDASMTEAGDLDLVLTREGYEVMEQALELLRETNPKATYEDVLMFALSDLIDELEAEMN